MKQTQKNIKFLCIVLLLMESAIFGFSFIVLQKLIDYNCPTFFIISVRFSIGSIVLFLFSVLVPKNHLLNFRIDKKSVIYGLLCGMVMFIGFALQTYGATYTSSANNGLFSGLYVIFVPLISMLIHKRLNAIVFFSSFMSMIGVALVSGFTMDSFFVNTGDILSIICGFVFAIQFIMLEKYTPNVNISSFTIVQLLTVAILSCVISPVLEKNLYHHIEWKESLIWLILLGIISTAITYIIQSYAQSKITANTASIISCSESVFAVIFSLLLGYEQISSKLMVGFIIVFVAMLLVTINNSQEYSLS